MNEDSKRIILLENVLIDCIMEILLLKYFSNLFLLSMPVLPVPCH